MRRLIRHDLPRCSSWALTACFVLLGPRAVCALQPLDAFLAASQRNNPDNVEASATERQRVAQRDAATAAYLPSFTAQGVYTHNQYDASFNFNGQNLTITPQNGLDAYLTLSVPIVNIGAWQQRAAATANIASAAATRANTALSVESAVTQAYYQLLGAEAVLFSAKKTVEVSSGNLQLVRDRQEFGTASDLDLQRALADVARAEKDAAAAEQNVVLGRRSLESLSRLAPEAATPDDYREDDLREETSLETWLTTESDDLIAVKPALRAIDAAEVSRKATRAAWLPTLSAQGQERFTNAGGFTGRNQYYTLTATASWRVDFALAPNVAAQTEAVAAARAREDKARRSAEDAIFRAWHQVRVGIEKARSARAQFKAATLAQDLARDRYKGGVATQLEVVQAQRDYFVAAVDQVQADFDLRYARALLRLSARRTDGKEAPR
ncbi:MAG: TolC family protein [Polyangiales bacterium]